MPPIGENEQPRANVTPPDADASAGGAPQQLEWQSELDSAMATLDTQLSHPRRRASDAGPQPVLPELGKVEITSELLDEISWRVAQQLRRNHPNSDSQEDRSPATLPPPVVAAAPASSIEPGPARLSGGVAVTIRLRSPLFRFRWRFWRRSRRRHSMITFADYRIS